MVSVQTGTPYTTTLLVTDDDGAPVTSGVTGSMDLYGPASATALATGVALTHYGDGNWGATWTGAQLATAGLYRAVVPTLAFGATTIQDAGALFTVGEVPPDYRTLRALLTSVYTALRDGVAGTGTAQSATVLRDAARAGGGLDDNEWNGTELLLLGPTRPATNPQRVGAFAHATGDFTLATGGLTSGATYDYLLVNRKGAGWPYARVLDALLGVIDGVRRQERVVDQVALTTAWGQFEYALPAGWRTVTEVQIANVIAPGDVDDGYYWPGPGGWGAVAPAYWDWDPQRRVLIDTYGRWPGGRALRLSGTIDVPPPATLGSVVPLPWTWVRDATLAELLVSSGDPADQRRAAFLYNRTRQRPRRVEA